MASGLQQILESYGTCSPHQAAELERAKQDFYAIQDYLDRNLKTKKKKLAVNYARVEATRQLDDAVRVEDASFDLIVKIEEDGLLAQEHSSDPGLWELTGLSPNTQMYCNDGGRFLQRFSSDVRRCLNRLVNNAPDFAKHLAVRVNMKVLTCQIVVNKTPEPSAMTTKKNAVPTISAKHVNFEPPWFIINLKVVVCHEANGYILTSLPVGQTTVSGPVWISFREDSLAAHFKPIQVLLQALLYTRPMLCQHSVHDIAASVLDVYDQYTSRMQYPVDWNNLEELLLCVIDELAKAYKRQHLTYHGCHSVNLLEGVHKKFGNKMSAFLTELMLKNCEKVGEVIADIMDRNREE